jgi:hypothetical protein
MLNVIMLSVIMLCHYSECHYAECRYAGRHYAECHYAKCRGAVNYTVKLLPLQNKLRQSLYVSLHAVAYFAVAIGFMPFSHSRCHWTGFEPLTL